ncbi:MAG: CPBP family intramembrane metalloprotease [Desulfobacteraceae bacterium]|nr:CPBP family intramembrane metalloprotease [Desulfobacteraceae bacterium]
MTYKIEWNVMKDKMRNSVFLAAAAMFGTLPMFQYHFRHFAGSLFTRQPTAEQIYYLALGQSFMVFLLAFLCSLVGFLYSERLQLPEFGKTSDIPGWLCMGLLVGLFFTPISYYFCDREVFRVIPEIFPNSSLWALANMSGIALAQEVIVRFGLLTIGIYLARRWGLKGYAWPVIVVISIFGALGTYVFLAKFDLVHKLFPSQLLISLIMAFFLQWIFCEIYLRKGFLAVLCIHFGLDIKFLVYSLVISA